MEDYQDDPAWPATDAITECPWVMPAELCPPEKAM